MEFGWQQLARREAASDHVVPRGAVSRGMARLRRRLGTWRRWTTPVPLPRGTSRGTRPLGPRGSLDAVVSAG